MGTLRSLPGRNSGDWFAHTVGKVAGFSLHAGVASKPQERNKLKMTLAPGEFIRRFLLHILPSGFHRIRHYGLIADTTRKDKLARARELLMSKVTDEPTDAETNGADTVDGCDESVTYVCPDCGAPMRVIDIFLGGQLPRAPPVSVGGS